MEIMATSKNYGKKKVRITSGIFWTLMGKNPIMEKSDAGAACLSWTFFFHNSVGYHNQSLLGKFSNAIGAPFRLQEQVMEMQDDYLMTLGARRDLSRYYGHMGIS